MRYDFSYLYKLVAEIPIYGKRRQLLAGIAIRNLFMMEMDH